MRTRTAISAAKALGTETGRSAASWVFDGNTSTDTYRALLEGLEDGDPATYDAFGPSSGWLSGEWADCETTSTLFARIGFDTSRDTYGERSNDVATAFEDAAESSYWAELERVARSQVSE